MAGLDPQEVWAEVDELLGSGRYPDAVAAIEALYDDLRDSDVSDAAAFARAIRAAAEAGDLEAVIRLAKLMEKVLST